MVSRSGNNSRQCTNPCITNPCNSETVSTTSKYLFPAVEKANGHMAMVQVTNKKDETIHWMRLDPGFAALFLLYRYRCWKCQFCNTITSPIPNTISAGGST